MTNPPGRFFRTPQLWLFVLCVAEFWAFDQFGSHRVTGFYPRWNDQIQYLSEAYAGHEYARAHGLAAGLWHALVNLSAQGTLHDFAAVLLFHVTGASRSAALALNMLAFIAWQGALFGAVGRVTRSFALAFAAAMLPLTLRGPWLIVPGSAYDFRLDHFALCAMGVTSALAVATRGFRVRSLAIAFGLATGVTLLTRFITGTYFLLIFVALAAWIFGGAERGRRLANLGIAAALAAVIAGPIFWLNREWVWNYYVIGHYVGPESAIRNQNFGLLRSLDFVGGWLAERHLGVVFAVTAAGVAVALAILRRIAARQGSANSGDIVGEATTRESSYGVAANGGIFLLAPALVLTLHPQKSEVVLSALVPGVVLLVIALWTWIARGLGTVSGRTAKGLVAIAILTVVVAAGSFWQRQLVSQEDAATIANLRQVNGVADYIFSAVQTSRMERPRIAVDHITDALDAQVLRVVCYERHHVWIDFDMKLPTGIAEPDAGLVQQRLSESDFVFLIDDDLPFGSYPYDRKLFEMRPALRVWCATHLQPLRRFTLWGRPFVLYQRVGFSSVVPSAPSR